MCGRFTLYSSATAIEQETGVEIPDISPNYNVAPTQFVLTIASNQEQTKAGFLKWGLVPSWSKDPSVGHKMINARAETVDEKPSFKKLLERRRCLVVADSFYEWKKEGKEKQPYRIMLNEEQIFTFAGLWDRWEGEEETITSCTIITTEANELMQDLHHRMPVIIPKNRREAWLHPNTSKTEVKAMLEPFESGQMTAYPVSRDVNSPKNNTPELLEKH
ncbi:putative SOS response-associated peptidase YedK [Sinobaca qinghaiensis]|uniref:Abasic site processing protein n=1 Tax=Sinobaca qinghaiensis TaxID=342944 RepID=A0A419V517_9BACL|nr:SOS response-associated peptidase [Sinobaca qinghaiensis]RKD73610.1 putative SOS response-associated peptidase YedK [Sinobaca qinghaiensis]